MVLGNSGAPSLCPATRKGGRNCFQRALVMNSKLHAHAGHASSGRAMNTTARSASAVPSPSCSRQRLRGLRRGSVGPAWCVPAPPPRADGHRAAHAGHSPSSSQGRHLHAATAPRRQQPPSRLLATPAHGHPRSLPSALSPVGPGPPAQLLDRQLCRGDVGRSPGSATRSLELHKAHSPRRRRRPLAELKALGRLLPSQSRPLSFKLKV
jgi:hypothetical protein